MYRNLQWTFLMPFLSLKEFPCHAAFIIYVKQILSHQNRDKELLQCLSEVVESDVMNSLINFFRKIFFVNIQSVFTTRPT